MSQPPSTTKQSKVIPILVGVGATIGVVALVWFVSSMRAPQATTPVDATNPAAVQGAQAPVAGSVQPVPLSNQVVASPSGVSPTGVAPAGVSPTGVPPAGVSPTGVSPASVSLPAVAQASPASLILKLEDDVEVEFKWIRPGSFMMGSDKHPNEDDEHKVTISRGFEMSEYEVTQAQWKAVVGTEPSGHRNCPKCPVENVSWEDTREFMKELNEKEDGYRYRLPTEAEWEYAARAGKTGDYGGDLGDMAWYSENSGRETHPVGLKEDNAWGLHDMHGNVWEWVSDWYEDQYSDEAVTDPKGPSSGSKKICRGGAFHYDADSARSAFRSPWGPTGRANDVGFRVVRVRK